MVRTNTHRDIPGYIESLDRRLKSVEGSAMGPQTLGEKSEMRKPAAPTDFTAIPILVFDSTGGTISSIACQWKSVHFSNGYEESFYTNIEIKTYEVWARQIDSLDDDTWSMVSTVEQPLFFPNLDDTITPVDVFATFNVIGGGVRYEVRVTAIGKDYNNYGDWSQVVPVTSVNDLTAPPVPSPPLVDIQADLAVVSWNGLPTMPVDFRYCEVGYTEFAGLDPTITGRIYSPDDVVFIAPAYSQDTFYYLRSVDFSGNTSAWCTPTSVNIPAPASGVSESAVKDWIEETQEETQTAINNIAQEAALASQKAQEAKDAADIAIVESKYFYALSSSEDTPPTSGWTDTPPLRGDNQFIWIKTQVTYGNNSVGEGDPVLITGNTGNGLRSTTISYAKSVSGVTPPSTGWGSSIPSLSDSEYLWTRTILEYSNSTTSTSYSVSRNGTNGSSGKGILSSTIHYQLGASGVTPPTGTWVINPPVQTPALPFLWTRTVFNYTDSTSSTTYSISKLGESGVGVSSITPFYLIKNSTESAPTKLTTNPPPAPWQETEPEYEIRTALYRTDRILYTNGDFTYTAVTRVESYTAATIAISAANMVEQAMQGLIRMSNTEPEDPTVGTIWFQLDAETSDIIGIKLYNGEDWISYALLADQVLVPSSVGGISIGEGQITTPNIAARAIIAELIAAGAIEAEHLSIGSVTKEALDSAVNETLEEAAEWAKRTILEPGKITITNGGASATQMVLTPTRLSFVVRGTEVASIDSLSQEMNIKKAVIGESLKTGNHIIEKYTDEITIIRWVG